MEAPATTKLKIGPDSVFLVGEHVVIPAVRPMADWTLREFCVRAIFFQDKKYYLKHKMATAPPYAFRYELALWTTEQSA